MRLSRKKLISLFFFSLSRNHKGKNWTFTVAFKNHTLQKLCSSVLDASLSGGLVPSAPSCIIPPERLAILCLTLYYNDFRVIPLLIVYPTDPQARDIRLGRRRLGGVQQR